MQYVGVPVAYCKLLISELLYLAIDRCKPIAEIYNRNKAVEIYTRMTLIAPINGNIAISLTSYQFITVLTTL